MWKNYYYMNKWLIVFLTTCVTLEKPHCGISKGILCMFGSLVLLCIKCNIEKRIRKQNQEVNDLKIIDTKKEMKNQNYWTLNNQSVIGLVLPLTAFKSFVKHRQLLIN